MLTKINTTSEDFLKIVDFYYEKENFNLNIEIFKKIVNYYNDLKLDGSLYNKIFTKMTTVDMDKEEEIKYKIDLDIMKKENVDFFLYVIKLLQTFSDECLSSLKIILHLDQILSNSLYDNINPDLLKERRIDIIIYNLDNLFTLNSKLDLKINTYVEFLGNVKKLSALKTVNTRVNVSCSICGLIFTKRVDRIQSTKMYNTYTLNNDKKLHNCEGENNNYDSNKLYREYCDPILIRYLNVELNLTQNLNNQNLNNQKNINNNNSSLNNSIICLVKENLLNSEFPIWEMVKICGIVKTRPDLNNNNNNFNGNSVDNFFEKIVEISHIERIEILQDQNNLYNLEDCHISNNLNNSPFFTNNNITEDDLKKFSQFSQYSQIQTFLLLNLINPKILQNFEFVNLISLYFILSQNLNLKIHIVDMTKTESLKQNLINLPNNKVIYHDNIQDDILFYKDINKMRQEEFVFKFGRIYNSNKSKFLIIERINPNNSNLINFLNLNMNNLNFPILNINSTEGSQSLSEFRSFSSILTTSKINENANSNNSLFLNYDIILFYQDKTDSNKDRKKTNQILDNQFNMRKRKFSDISNETTQNFSQIVTNQTQLEPNSILNLNNREDLYSLDTISISDFYKKLLREDFDKIKSDQFFNEMRDTYILNKYLSFVNEFINPKINYNNKIIIQNLSLHLIESFSDLITSDMTLINFDSNGENINRILSNFVIINARMKMREEILNEDIIFGYLAIKEIVTQNFINCLSNKRNNVNKGKKNKISFVMEKIRQICALNSRKTFSKVEVKEACEFVNMNDEIDMIIEKLNYEGFMIKINGEEYQLVN